GTPFLTPQNKALSRGVRWFTRTSPQMVERVPGQRLPFLGSPVILSRNAFLIQQCGPLPG
ncbi:hypothetical protein, partial [Leptospirillum ferriphilum]|uniref:hypothetical protein n=1 Tax=Leptospirillum ferriphilum TaxID=178606 RepID=UPI001F3383DF